MWWQKRWTLARMSLAGFGDRLVERGGAAMDAATELALGELGEEALDLIEPGRTQLRTVGALWVA